MAEKILIISPVPVFPVHAGNRERIRSVCSVLKNRGYVLDFFYAGFDHHLDSRHQSFFSGEVFDHLVKQQKDPFAKNPVRRIRQILNGFKVRIHRRFRRIADGSGSAEYNKSLYEYRNQGKMTLLDEQIDSKKYHAVIINYAPYSFYFDLFDKQTIKIIDTHDRLTDRYQLFLDNDQKPINWHSLRYKDEKKSISKANVVWAITDEEYQHFSEMVNSAQTRVYTLGHLMPYKKIEAKNPKRKILMIGSANRLNLEGLEWFLDQVWIRLWELDSEIQFLIAGSICKAISQDMDDDRIGLLGYYDTSEDVYSEGDLFINPMPGGTGLKIKTFEALAHGKYVVSTAAGATGLQNMIGSGLVCSDEPSIWIQKILSFFDHKEQAAEELEKAAFKITEMYQNHVKVIDDSLDEITRKKQV